MESMSGPTVLAMLFAEAAGQNASVPLGCVLGVSVIITCQLGKAMVPGTWSNIFIDISLKVLGVCVCVFLEDINI